MGQETGTWVRYGEREQFQGYQCGQAHAAKAGIVVIQEIWGVDRHIQEVASRLAGEGYHVIAPNLFFQDGKQIPELEAERIETAKRFLDTLPSADWWNESSRTAALAHYPEDERVSLGQTLDKVMSAPRQSAQLLGAAIEAARWLRASGAGKVGVVGFCMGGGMAAQLAMTGEVQASAVFYGNLPKPEQAGELACPVIGFFGELDHRITDQVPAFREACAQAGKSFDPHVYTGAPHAFFNDTRTSYREDAAKDAYRRLLDFFSRELKG